MVMQLKGGNALLISPCKGDHEFLQSLFLANGWTLRWATSLESARRLVQKAPVIVTEADLNPGTWKGVLALAEDLLNPPLVIVVSTHADDYLWVEALNLGAHDVIAKPFDMLGVTRILTAAWSRWEHSVVPKKGMSASDRRAIARSANRGCNQSNS